ncbi:MAG: GyrI-like domain-containing protein [Acidobacteriota bacterium]
MSTKIDLFKAHKADYVARKKPCLVEIAAAPYLSVAGQGEPGGEAFQNRVAILMPVAYTLKFDSKAAGQDYVVCKLEGIWYGEDGASLDDTPQEAWRWRLLIRVPGFITAAQVAAAAEKVATKQGKDEVRYVGFETLEEGLCVQMLHVGPYDQEPETVAAMRAFAEAEGLTLAGPHHEIYLSDPRRVEPARLKTILRWPVRS